MVGSGVMRGGTTIDNQPEKERVTMRGNNATRSRCSSRDEKAPKLDADQSATQDFILCL